MIHDIINKNFSGAEKLVRENLENIAERKIIEMKKMIAAKNVMEENERRVTGISKAAVDKIGQSTDTEHSYEVDKANTPEKTPADRVKDGDGFDDMENPNTKENQLKEKAPPGAKYERMVKHIKAKYAKNGLTDKEKSIAYATAWKAKNANIEEETLDETVDYPMSYMKSHPKHVEIHHVTFSGHDNPHKTPERAKQQVLTNPKHKELKDQGYSIHSYGQHSEPKDYYTRPVRITKEKKSLDEALPKVYGRNKLVARERMDADRKKQKPIIKVSLADKDIGYKIADIGPGQKEHNIKTHNWVVKEEESLDEARFKIVKARIRNGKVQRRKKVSTARGLTFRGGKLTRMSPSERRHRKMGQRRGKLKRRAKMSRILRKRTMSLRKRSRLGIK